MAKYQTYEFPSEDDIKTPLLEKNVSLIISSSCHSYKILIENVVSNRIDYSQSLYAMIYYWNGWSALRVNKQTKKIKKNLVVMY